ncbi:hypothetical protein B0H12DRAFT_92801 [Mycena haematopus]|nr:hypothetical protein B0H12DRAFT_92801 [Mycena haematopus]
MMLGCAELVSAIKTRGSWTAPLFLGCLVWTERFKFTFRTFVGLYQSPKAVPSPIAAPRRTCYILRTYFRPCPSHNCLMQVSKMVSTSFNITQYLRENSALVASPAGRGFKDSLRNFTPAEKFSRIWDLENNTFKASKAHDGRLYGFNTDVKDVGDYLVCNDQGAGDTIRLYLTYNGNRTNFQRDHVFELRFLSMIFMRHAEVDQATQKIVFVEPALYWLCEVASDAANCVWLPQRFHTDKTNYFSGSSALTEEVRLFLVECAASLAKMVAAKHADFFNVGYGDYANNMITEMATNMLSSPFCNPGWFETGTMWSI